MERNVLILMCIVCAILLNCNVYGVKILKLEAENYWKNFIYRQKASQDKTVSLHENEKMTLPFCLRRRTNVTIHNVLYTNDGWPNTVRMYIDSVAIGEWTSHNLSDNGRLWNSINTTGTIGEPINLKSGPHKLGVHVIPSSSAGRVDPYGIEIDVVYLSINDSEISTHFLHCFNTMCSDGINYEDRHRDRDDIPSGRIIQMSRPSTCLEEDNIKIPIYHENIRQFRISALPPRYRTFWTFKHAQFEGCPEYSQYHWQYMSVDCSNTSHTRTHRSSVLTYDKTDHKTCKVIIRFDLEGVSYGKTDAHIGDILEIGIHGNTDKRVLIRTSFGVSRNGNVSYGFVKPFILHSNHSMGNVRFPDFTWAERSYWAKHLNEITLEMPSDATLAFIRLRRREEHPGVSTDIFDNQQMKIQKAVFDFWWRDPVIVSGQESNMEVYLATIDGEQYKGKAHYIVFVEKRVWAPSGNMDQTFVLYQDGSARILPIVPHGLESYVPFGNDIVIGQADPLHVRPHAPIKKLVIKPEKHMLDVYYNDGGFATIHIFASVEETNITVSNISFMGSMRFNPFAIFRSTWVEDGRAKVDHVTVNGLPADHILLDDWTTLYGTTFVFFRKCISVYNTQSPDFAVEILSDSELKPKRNQWHHRVV